MCYNDFCFSVQPVACGDLCNGSLDNEKILKSFRENKYHTQMVKNHNDFDLLHSSPGSQQLKTMTSESLKEKYFEFRILYPTKLSTGDEQNKHISDKLPSQEATDFSKIRE